MDPKPECEELEQKLRQAKDENVKLQAIISDITQVNKRWQRYNSDRQMYVQKLLNTIQDQQVQINNMGEETAYHSKQTEQHESAVEGCTKKECRLMREDVKRLQESVQLLEFQVRAHKDDWEAERNEKEQIVKERDSTKSQLVELVRELQALRRLINQCSCYNKTYNIGFEQEETSRHSNRGRKPSESFNNVQNGLSQQRAGPCDLFNDGDLTCDGVPSEEGSNSFDRLREYDEDAAEENACALSAAPYPQGSYSRSSTLPAGGTPGDSVWTEEERLPLISVSSSAYVRLPVVKSSSAPERRSFGKKGAGPPECAASISLNLLPPPPSPSQTLTRQDVVCPNCALRFPAESHLEFLDHFDDCQKA